jgi:hypothetical protein
MQIGALRHAQMIKELLMLQVVISSATEIVLRRLPTKTLRVEVVDELVAEFWKQEKRWSRLERHGTSVCDPILGPPFGRAWLADRLKEATRLLVAKQAAQWEMDTDLEAL